MSPCASRPARSVKSKRLQQSSDKKNWSPSFKFNLLVMTITIGRQCLVTAKPARKREMLRQSRLERCCIRDGGTLLMALAAVSAGMGEVARGCRLNTAELRPGETVGGGGSGAPPKQPSLKPRCTFDGCRSLFLCALTCAHLALLRAAATSHALSHHAHASPVISTYASYGEWNGRKRRFLFCAKHRLPQHIDLKNRRCDWQGTTADRQAARHAAKSGVGRRVPTRLLQYLPPSEFAAHSSGERDRKFKLQEHLSGGGCTKLPTYAYAGDRVPRRCSSHRLPGQIPFKRTIASRRGWEYQRKCMVAGCQTTATFGDPHDRKKVSCAKHRLPSHCDLKNPQKKSDQVSRQFQSQMEAGEGVGNFSPSRREMWRGGMWEHEETLWGQLQETANFFSHHGQSLKIQRTPSPQDLKVMWPFFSLSLSLSPSVSLCLPLFVVGHCLCTHTHTHTLLHTHTPGS